MPLDFIERADISESELDDLTASIPKWISIKDRFPDDYIEVLYFAINDIGTKEIMTGHRVEGTWTHCCMFYRTVKLNDLVTVTHWMPLPKPPNE